jgi:hypothetical protein
MALRRYTVPVRTAADGSATVYSPWMSGYVHEIHYIKDGSNAYTDGVDFTITAEATGETIWAQLDVNASVVKAPRQATHSTAGVAALYAAAGTAVNDRIALGRDRAKIALAAGGNAKDGQFMFVMAD